MSVRTRQAGAKDSEGMILISWPSERTLWPWWWLDVPDDGLQQSKGIVVSRLTHLCHCRIQMQEECTEGASGLSCIRRKRLMEIAICEVVALEDARKRRGFPRNGGHLTITMFTTYCILCAQHKSLLLISVEHVISAQTPRRRW
jgi:hypothetical protein